MNLPTPDRLKRVHVHNVRGKDNKFYVVLFDERGVFDSEMTWQEWVNGGCEEIRNQKRNQT